jgi:urease accessory protein
MTFGAVLGVMGIPLPGIEVGIAVSAIVLGTVVAMNLRPPLIIAFSIIAFFAIYHGHPHGTALPDFGVPLHYAAGFVVSTGLLHLSGISIGYLYRWKIGERLVRSLGFCISLTGFYFLTAAIGLTT